MSVHSGMTSDTFYKATRRPLLLDLGPGGSIPPQPMRSPHRKKGSPKRGHTPAYSPKAFQQFVEKGQSIFEAAYERSSASNNSIMTSRISAHESKLLDPHSIVSEGIMGPEDSRDLSREQELTLVFNTVKPTLGDVLIPDEGSGYYDSVEDYAKWMVIQSDEEARSEACIRCQQCGSRHYNPKLVDLYRSCPRCQCALRQPEDLRSDGWARRGGGVDRSQKLQNAVRKSMVVSAMGKRPSSRGKRPSSREKQPESDGEKPGSPALQPMNAVPLRILAASYGHPDDPALAISVLDILNARVGKKNHLVIQPNEDLRVTFKKDPCPGTPKVLHIRYESIPGKIHSASRRFRCEVKWHEGKDGFLPKVSRIKTPANLPSLLIHRATYGNPRGMDVHTKRGAFDISEMVQARIDASGGSFLHIGHTEHLPTIFGDPSVGKIKDLVILYEICGVGGEEHEFEMNGFLISDLKIEARPQLAPLLIIQSATWGQTQEGLNAKIKVLQKKMIDLTFLRKQKATGVVLSREDNKRLWHLPKIEAELEFLEHSEVAYTDIREQLQRRVEQLGRGGLLYFNGIKRDIDKRTGRSDFTPDDLNDLFGSNPLPGRHKQLIIEYYIPGHDADSMTDSNEITASGFQRNTITKKRATIVYEVDEDDMGRSYLDMDVEIRAPEVMPVVEVSRATYGHATDLSKAFDVTSEVRTLVQASGGTTVCIKKDEDLYALFRDPCRGVRKKLSIEYVVRGYMGTMRVNSQDGHLLADLDLGYPVQEALDEETIKQNAIITARKATMSRRVSESHKKRHEGANRHGAVAPGGDAAPKKPAAPVQAIAAPEGAKRRTLKRSMSGRPRRGLPTITETGR